MIEFLCAVFLDPFYIAGGVCALLFELYELYATAELSTGDKDDAPLCVRVLWVVGPLQRALGSALTWPVSVVVYAWLYITGEWRPGDIP